MLIPLDQGRGGYLQQLMPLLDIGCAEHLSAHGYAVVERVLGAEEATELRFQLASSPIPRSRAGIRHALRDPHVRTLANDPRLLSIAQKVLGREALPFHATLFDKSPGANWLVVWHQDTALPLRAKTEAPGWGPWSSKNGVVYAHAPASALEQVLALRVHLDDSTAENGSLRVLPGTHNRGVLGDDEIARLATETPPHECLVQQGDILCMRPLIVHASSKSTSPTLSRRVLHIEYASASCLDGMELAIS